jgi:sialidase-1
MIPLFAMCFALPVVQAEGGAAAAEPFTDYVMRGNLLRSQAKFAAGGPARVVFMGGSVTTRQWRNPLMTSLTERFPGAEFDFVMAGIGGTDANLGAFRLPEQVFGRGKVDLFFLEFAVNGGGVRAMEGIVRQAKRLNPEIDIVILYFANTGHTASYANGKIPGIVQEHEKVAEHYGIPALYLYREIARRIEQGKIKWEDFAGDSVHPNQGGCDMYTQCIQDFLAASWGDAALALAAPRPCRNRSIRSATRTGGSSPSNRRW